MSVLHNKVERISVSSACGSMLLDYWLSVIFGPVTVVTPRHRFVMMHKVDAYTDAYNLHTTIFDTTLERFSFECGKVIGFAFAFAFGFHAT